MPRWSRRTWSGPAGAEALVEAVPWTSAVAPVTGVRGPVDQPLEAARRRVGRGDPEPRGQGRGRLRGVGGAGTGAGAGPAVDPVEAVEQHGTTVDPEGRRQPRVGPVDRVVGDEVAPLGVRDDGVVAGADEAVAVLRQHGGAADPRREQRRALGVDERSERRARPAGEDGVARRRAGAAVRGRAHEVVEVAVPHDVGALVAVVDGDLRGRADRRQAVRRHPRHPEAAEVAAVVEVALAGGVGEARRVEGPEEAAARRLAVAAPRARPSRSTGRRASAPSQPRSPSRRRG